MYHFTMDCLSDTKAYMSWQEGGSWITKLGVSNICIMSVLILIIVYNWKENDIKHQMKIIILLVSNNEEL